MRFNKYKAKIKKLFSSMRNSSVKWSHLANLDPNSTNTILPTNTMESSSTL